MTASFWSGPIAAGETLKIGSRPDVERIMELWRATLALHVHDGPMRQVKQRVIGKFMLDIKDILWTFVIELSGSEPAPDIADMMSLTVMRLEAELGVLATAKGVFSDALDQYPASLRPVAGVCPRSDLPPALHIVKGLTHTQWTLLRKKGDDGTHCALRELTPILKRWQDYIEGLTYALRDPECTAHGLAAHEMCEIEAKAEIISKLLGFLERPAKVDLGKLYGVKPAKVKHTMASVSCPCGNAVFVAN